MDCWKGNFLLINFDIEKGQEFKRNRLQNKSYSTALTKIRIAQNKTFFGDTGKTQGLVALLYTKEMLPGVYTNN